MSSPLKRKRSETSTSSSSSSEDSVISPSPTYQPKRPFFTAAGHDPTVPINVDSSSSRSSGGSTSSEDSATLGSKEEERRGLGALSSMSDKRKRALENDSKNRPKKAMPSYSSFSMKMMASMGYKPGYGLGRSNTGITAPIEESLQKGRRGLGFYLDGLEKEDVTWEEEEVSYEQEPVWLPSCTLPVLTEDDMDEWITIGHRKNTINDEINYCDEEILEKILASKSVFDSLSEKEFLDARQRSNPFETIKGAIFQNRAATKMANIDAIFNFMFTNGFKLHANELLYFADICAGPGGFSEYVFWRKKWNAKGFGFTLKAPDSGFDFKLDSFIAGPCETFDNHYGVGSYDGDGDITNPENIEEFRSYVHQQTEGMGVHFVMADGGISVEGQENIQEILLKELVLCQYLCALTILRTGGHFVCKVFDMFTPFSVGLFYILYRSFEQVCIFKPVTSRPANSERYVVCKSLRADNQCVTHYLMAIKSTLSDIPKENDILEVVPYHLLQTEPFYTYMTDSNDSIGVNQIISLKKLKYFVKNTNLQEHRQVELRNNCLKMWKVPTSLREIPVSSTTDEIFTKIWNKQAPPQRQGPPVSLSDVKYLVSDNFKKCERDSLPFMIDPHSWKWYFACGKRYLLVGLGRNQIHSWDMRGIKATFLQRTEFKLELPKGTIIEVEYVQERKGEGQGQAYTNIVYVVDVLAINEELYTNKPLKERLLVAEKLCKAVNKPCRKGYIEMKVKHYYRLKEMTTIFGDLSLKRCKGMGLTPTLDLSHSGNLIAPLGIIFCKVIAEPWQLHLSSKGHFYFFNYKTNDRTFETPPQSVSPYLTVVSTRHVWMWSPRISQDICSSHHKDNMTQDIPSSNPSLLVNDLTWSHLRSILK